MEAFQISYDAKPTWGQRTTFNITRYADLMYTMIVEIDIPQINAKYTSYSVNKGEKIGISGKSGSGKSTLINLLLGLYLLFDFLMVTYLLRLNAYQSYSCGDHLKHLQLANLSP